MGPYVALIGPQEADAETLALAEEVGRHLARAGAVLLCGGRGGAMEAAARGAAAEGGVCIGILPGTDRSEGNPHLTYALPTGLGIARNAVLAAGADAVIAVGGAHGTLSEIGLALKLGRPVVGLATWEIARAGRPEPGLERAADPAAAVARALARARQG